MLGAGLDCWLVTRQSVCLYLQLKKRSFLPENVFLLTWLISVGIETYIEDIYFFEVNTKYIFIECVENIRIFMSAQHE